MAETGGGSPPPKIPANNKGGNPEGDEDLIVGNCATCDSTLRWPRHLDVYRCTVCLMINDLKPTANEDHSIHQNGSPQEPRPQGVRIPRKGLFAPHVS
jgi:E3 ubiquitin-protein ligase HECTD2